MNEQYFTPAMEDLRVGYECESYNNHVWVKMIFTTKDFDGLPLDIDGRWLRTPYITREQIEKEGWEFDFGMVGHLYFKKGRDKVGLFELGKTIRIERPSNYRVYE